MEKRSITLIALTVLSSFLFTVILILACIVWQRIRNKEKNRKYDLLNPKIETEDIQMFINNGTKLPMSSWTIPVQSEIIPQQIYNTLPIRYSNSSSRRNSSNNVPDVSELNQEHYVKPRSYSSCSTSSSIVFEDEEFEIRTKLEDQERRISEGVLEHLIKQGRKVSLSDLRTSGTLLEDSMTTVNRSQYSINSSQSSSHDDDLFDSSTIGIKHRVCRQRQLRRTSGFGGIRHDTPKMYKKAGTIEFAIEYFLEEDKLDIEIGNISLITSRLAACEVNPFVMIYLEPGKKQKQQTSGKKGTKEPVFNETITFQKLKKDDLLKTLLKIKVMNQEKLKKSYKLGEAGIALSLINITKKETFNAELFIQRMKASLTSICIDMCHKAMSSKLEVNVKAVKNLPKCGMLGTYVAILLFRENKLIRKETSIKRNTRDPVFNEILEFDVYTDILTPLTTHSIVVTVNSQNIGKDEVIGHVIFNMASPQKSATEQWKLVHNVPYQNHVGWHSLVNPDDL